MKITENEIKRICSKTVYKNGLEYYKEGRVHLKQRKEDSLVACVDDERLYNVHIGFSGDKITETFCTCPYFQTMHSPCKHIVATLMVRKSELDDTRNFASENDALANAFCKDFSAQKKEQYGILANFYITETNEGTSYSLSFSLLGSEGNYQLSSIEGFLEAIILKKDFRLLKNKVFNIKNATFEEFSGKVIKILCDAYCDKKAGADFYSPQMYRTSFGEGTAKRLFGVLKNISCDYIIDSVGYKNLPIIYDNPDIMIDVSAVDKNICLSATESASALTSDGEAVFYDNKIYITDSEWRSWFMPIYENMIKKRRTRLEFSGEACVDFVANVLPKIKQKQGVVCYGVDELVVDEKPDFFVYFDRFSEGIRAKIEARYGDTSVYFPTSITTSSKLIVRDKAREDEVLKFFEEFYSKDGYFNLYDEEKMFYFLTIYLPKLKEIASVIENDAFNSLLLEDLPEISALISYNEKVDLLEFSLKSKLSPDELSGILEAYYQNQSYFRFSDGSFYDFSKKNEVLSMLQNLPEQAVLGNDRKLSKFYALYFAQKCKQKNITADEKFWAMLKQGMNEKCEIPEHLLKVLRDYQKTGVKWLSELSELGLGGILADEMGLGKTLQVIAFVMSKKKKLPSLVVAPSSLLYNWYEEIIRFAPKAKVKIADGPKEERTDSLKNLSGYDFVITSYALLRRDVKEYENMEFAYCFIDEAQHIKNARTMNARAVKKVKASSYFALTGTPIENAISELWSIFDFILPGYLQSEKTFLKKYGVSVQDGDPSKIRTLREKIKPFILRRVKKDVLSELPDKIENNIFAEFSEEQQKIYEAFLTLARNEVMTLSKRSENTVKILSLLTRLRQICCHPKLIKQDYKNQSGKLELLVELVTSGLGSGHRILIFSQFTSMLSIIRDTLKKEGIDTFYLDGSTPNRERVDIANRFNSGEKKVFLVSLKAGGTGLNLVGADTVIHYDPWWNPAVMDQASDRAHRIGQTRSVQVIKLVTKGSIEEQILKLSEKKRGLADGIIRENKSLLSSLTKKELLELFK